MAGPLMPPTMHGRAYWQVECACGHQRGYHTNDGTGSCAGQPSDGKAHPCEARCTGFTTPAKDQRVAAMYGPAPVGEPTELVGKHVRHKDVPDAVGFCTGVFAFSDEDNLMCQVEWEAPEVDPKTGRRPRHTALHYAGNLQPCDSPEAPNEEGAL
jgi:hypothetical protein